MTAPLGRSDPEGARVAHLSITPVKGTALHHPDAVELRRSGAVGDRAFFFVSDDDKLFSITRTGAFAGVRAEFGEVFSLFDGNELLCRGPVEPTDPIEAHFYGEKVVSGRIVPGPWTAALSARAGRSLRLVKADAPSGGIDVAPVTLLGSASIARLAEQIGEPVDPRRFRMLIHLDTDEPHVEDSWDGARLVGEEVELLVGGPVPRCAGITRHPDRGDRDLPLVREIKGYRGMPDLGPGPGVPFGVYAQVLREGTLRAGELLKLIP